MVIPSVRVGFQLAIKCYILWWTITKVPQLMIFCWPTGHMHSCSFVGRSE